MDSSVRLRFAPSPTGPLHIGGLRTALYNYLFAKKHGGTFILRSEDTDQNRYVTGAEEYIYKALLWCDLKPDEGPKEGGDFGPYRQSERKTIYSQHILGLLGNGTAYFAFDTPEEIQKMRDRMEAKGVHSPKYDHSTRMSMKNSLTLSEAEVEQLLKENQPYVVRLKVMPGETISFHDEIRGEVSFQSDELDDKVLMKADGLPTYHFANVVDDHSMRISHVIRGEEWLSSTAHHVLLYRAFGWSEEMPIFAHLPLLLKPTGKGKLSKRDGAKLGIPVFPMNWVSGEELYPGFKEMGFLPEAMINFLAFLGWNPGTEQEIFSMYELIEAFSLEHVSKGGARFDFDKAKWYNQQYILTVDSNVLVDALKEELSGHSMLDEEEFLKNYVELFRPRIQTLNEIYNIGYYFFEDIKEWNEKMIRKKWKSEKQSGYFDVQNKLTNLSLWSAVKIKETVEASMSELNYGYGDILPLLRLAVTGDVQGPDIFTTMALIGKEKINHRIENAPSKFNAIIN